MSSVKSTDSILPMKQHPVKKLDGQPVAGFRRELEKTYNKLQDLTNQIPESDTTDNAQKNASALTDDILKTRQMLQSLQQTFEDLPTETKGQERVSERTLSAYRQNATTPGSDETA